MRDDDKPPLIAPRIEVTAAELLKLYPKDVQKHIAEAMKKAGIKGKQTP